MRYRSLNGAGLYAGFLKQLTYCSVMERFVAFKAAAWGCPVISAGQGAVFMDKSEKQNFLRRTYDQ
ncbi:hypothetical protein BJN42_13925 [Pseudomonas koreensis]|nr:hypothetical protein BJN42_13925 [Pseudomonas koreensis]